MKRLCLGIINGLILIAIFLLPLPAFPAESRKAPGTRLGEFKVNNVGAATYTIPIVAPPGTNGMAPKLSLQYDSQKANGLLGVGWFLDGIPSIQRCPRTLAQDGSVGGVNFDSNDRYCLQGQRLIVINNKADGENLAEYRTEIDTFVRIFSYGVAGNGPKYFLVKNKAGETMEFGGNDVETQGRILAQGKTSVRVWALSKITDTSNNFLTVSYEVDDINGDFRPFEIKYTGNGTTVMQRSIKFQYESRTDQTPAFVGGSLVKIMKRLTNIKTYAPSSVSSGIVLVRNYFLQYENGTATGRSRVKTITECTVENCQAAPSFNCLTDGSCLPPTTLTWQDGTNATLPPTSVPKPSGWDNAKFWTGDFNGDGKQDLISNGNGQFITAFSNGDGTYTPAYFANPAQWNAGTAWTGDFNGDGKTDIVSVSSNNSNFITALSNGDGTYSTVTSSRCSSWNNSHVWRADFNGDGRTDLASDDGSSHLTFAFANVNGTFTCAPRQNLPGSWNNGYVFVGDFNGDGITDLVSDKGKFTYIFSNGDGTITPIEQVEPTGWSFSNLSWNAIAGDFNGDGITDLAQWSNGSIRFAFSKGDGTYYSPPTPAPWPSGWNINRGRSGDFNGDGKSDLMTTGSSSLIYVFSKGDGTISSISVPVPSSWDVTTNWSSDLNGDKKDDSLSSNANFNSVRFAGPFPDLLSAITNTIGGTVNLFYLPITDNSVYTKSSGSVYPIMDIQLPVYVVEHYVEHPNDPNGQAYSYTYDYVGARFSLDGRRGLGYQSVTILDETAGVLTTNYFNQDFPSTGLLDLSEIKNGSGTPFSQLKNKYTPVITVSPKVFFPALSRTDKSDCGSSGCMQTATSFEYDASGNQTRTLHRGIVTSQDDVAFSGDERDEQTEWVSNITDTNWVHRPKHKLLIDPNLIGDDQIVRESWLYYDGQGFDVLNGAGLLTTEEKRAVKGLSGDRGKPDNVVITHTYDQVFGNRVSTTDGIGCTIKTTTFDFTNTFPETVTRCFIQNPAPEDVHLVQTTRFTYNPQFGVKTSETAPYLNETDPKQTTTYTYDAFGRLISTIGPKDSVPSPTATYAYPNWGDATNQSIQTFTRIEHGQPGTILREEFLDGLGRIYKVKSTGPADFDTGASQKILEEMTFDSRDLLLTKGSPRFLTEPALPLTTFQYDVMGRQTKMTHPDLRHADIAYEPGVITSVDENGHAKIKFLNAYDEIEEIDEINHIAGAEETYKTFYDYDAAGALVQTTQKGKNNEFNLLTTITYDQLGRKTEMIDPNMGRWTYEYDKAGNLTKQITPNLRALNQTLTFEFDKLSRMTKKVYPNSGGEINFFYDISFVSDPDFPVGRLTKVIDLSATTILAYDEMGRVAQSKRTINGDLTRTLTQTYNALSKVTSETFQPDGDSFTYSYNEAGWLKSISETTPGAVSDYITKIGYNARAQKTKIQYDNNLLTTISYFDQLGDTKKNFLPKTRSTTGGTQDLGYGYDDVGNMTVITDGLFTARRTFTYDDLNRLTTAGGAFGPPQNGVPTDLPVPCTYVYDALGNMRNKCGVTYSYTDLNHPSFVTATSDGRNYSPDDNGNTLTGANRTFAWTPDNRVASVTQGSTVTMDYDSNGIRVKKTLGTSVTLYPFSGYEIEPDGTIIKRFKSGNDILAAKRSPSSTPFQKQFYHNDHLGGVNVLTDQSGNRIELNEYDPWGTISRSEPANEDSSPEPARRFTGKELDEETDLYYYEARYYDHDLARFESPDTVVPNPINPQTLNRYSYVNNNPVRLIDPSGHDAMDVLSAIKNAIVGTLTAIGNFFAPASPKTGGADDNPVKPANVATTKTPAAQATGVNAKSVPIPSCPSNCTQASSNPGRVEGVVMGNRGMSILVLGSDDEASISAGSGSTIERGLAPRTLDTEAAARAFATRAEASINVSEGGLRLIEQHLASFEDIGGINAQMFDRLRSALANGEKLTGADANFYLHELAEATMMRQGVSYEAAHAAALQKYGVSPYGVYHPDVIKQNPQSFSDAWRDFWKLKK